MNFLIVYLPLLAQPCVLLHRFNSVKSIRCKVLSLEGNKYKELAYSTTKLMKIRQLEAQNCRKIYHKSDFHITKCGRLNTWHKFHMTRRYIKLRTNMSKIHTGTQKSRLSKDIQNNHGSNITLKNRAHFYSGSCK